MNKKAKANEVIEVAVDVVTDDLLMDDLEETVVNDNTVNSLSMIPDSVATHDAPKSKAPKSKAPKSKDVTKGEAKPKPVAHDVIINMRAILAQLPDKVTPKDLDTTFGLYDGGKTVRRHLRKYFATNHDAKTTWEWTKNDPVLFEILTHFGSRYQAEIPEQKAQ